jgi:hypothetical protein
MRRILIVLAFISSAPALYSQGLEEQVAEMRTEIQLLRQELNEVKKQLQTQSATVEEIPVLQAQVQEQAQTKVETSSRFPLKLYGTVISNTFLNTGVANWIDLPDIALPSTPGLPAGSFSSVLRQTRIGATFDGPEVGKMKLNGTVAFDFYGGIPNFQTGPVMGLPRLVYAYVRLDGEKTAFEIGQDYMMLAPKNPTTLMGESFPTLYRSGNLYLRAPQIRAERVLASGDYGQIRVVGGMMAPISGDFAGAYQFVPPALAGERSRTPAVQSRLSWRAAPAGPYEQPRWEFGVSQHYSRDRFSSGIAPSWAGAGDFDATFGRFGLGGEYFVGRNLQAFGGSIGQSAKSQGGFGEGRFAATRRLSFNTGYGTDQLFDLVKFPATFTRNGTFFANSIYNFTPEFRGAFEYQRLVTRNINTGSQRNDHFNLTFAYSF